MCLPALPSTRAVSEGNARIVPVWGTIADWRRSWRRNIRWANSRRPIIAPALQVGLNSKSQSRGDTGHWLPNPFKAFSFSECFPNRPRSRDPRRPKGEESRPHEHTAGLGAPKPVFAPLPHLVSPNQGFSTSSAPSQTTRPRSWQTEAGAQREIPGGELGDRRRSRNRRETRAGGEWRKVQGAGENWRGGDGQERKGKKEARGRKRRKGRDDGG